MLSFIINDKNTTALLYVPLLPIIAQYMYRIISPSPGADKHYSLLNKSLVELFVGAEAFEKLRYAANHFYGIIAR